MSLIKISAAFDGGNIEVVQAEDPQNIQLNIRKDTKADYMQWFYFRMQEVQGMDLKIDILNASEASYPEGWEDIKQWFLMIESLGLGSPLPMMEKNSALSLCRSITVYLWPILPLIPTINT